MKNRTSRLTALSLFGVLGRWSHTRSCHTWRVNCISIQRALFMGRITRQFTVGVCKTRNRPGTPLDRLKNRGAPSPSGGVPGLFLVLQTSFQSEATEYYNTKRQNMINKSSDILFSNELESELGLNSESRGSNVWGTNTCANKLTKTLFFLSSVNTSLPEKLSKSRVKEVFWKVLLLVLRLSSDETLSLDFIIDSKCATWHILLGNHWQ